METSDKLLGRIDLNLLYAFQVLMEEQNVSRAAERMYITQPAMSNKLHRLRDIFGDPLFVRGSHGLTPTPRALQLSSSVGTALAQLARTIQGPPFDPAQCRGTINIQIPDSFSIALLPPLYERMTLHAPDLRLTSDNTTDIHLELLATGRADFSVYIADNYGEEFLTYRLGSISTVCWMRDNHPLNTRQSLSIEEVLAYPIAELTFVRHGHGFRSQEGLSRRYAELRESFHIDKMTRVGSSQLLTLLAVVLSTNTLLLGAPFLAKMNSKGQGLIYRPVNEYRDIQVPLVLIQHRRTATSAMHTWLRKHILSVAAMDSELRGNAGRPS